MDDEHRFDCFYKSVQDLWPDRRFTMDQLHVHWLDICTRGYEPPVVGAALRKCVSEFPKTPNWTFIFAELASSSKERSQGESRFQKLLEDYRLSADQKRRESNESIWARWISEGIRRTTHTMHYDRTKRVLVFAKRKSEPCTFCLKRDGVDCGLSGSACAAKRWAAFEHWRWRRYLADRGDPVPAFLTDDGGAAFIEPKETKATLF
jgi:hypothetical protein